MADEEATMLEAALFYAENGTPVFPVVPCAKAPLTRHGFKEATTNKKRIEGWWTAEPQANIAMPTGAFAGHNTFDVLDIDVRGNNTGWEIFEDLVSKGLMEEALAVIRTPSGGLHVWFKGSVQRSSTLRGKHVDFKARGGYVLLPPSYVATENYHGYYEVDDTTTIATMETAKPLNWQKVKELYTPQDVENSGKTGSGDYTTEYLLAWLEKQGEGNRNKALHWAVCRAIESGETHLDEFGLVALDIGLGVEEISATIRSAIAAYKIKERKANESAGGE